MAQYIPGVGYWQDNGVVIPIQDGDLAEGFAPGQTMSLGQAQAMHSSIPTSSTGYDGLTAYSGDAVTRGLRGAADNQYGVDIGGENATWVRNPATGKEEIGIQGPQGVYLLSDLQKKYGSLDAINGAGKGPADESGVFSRGLQLFNARGSNDFLSGKDGLADALKIAGMAAPVIGGAFAAPAAASTAAPAASGTLLADAGTTMTDVSPGLLDAGAGATDLGGGLSVDEFGNVAGGSNWAAAGGSDLGGGLTVDEFGNVTGGQFQGGPGTVGSGDFGAFDANGNPITDSGIDWKGIAKQYGPQVIPLLRDLARGIPGVAGAAASAAQANDLRDLAQKYLDLGAPSRARYESSFSPGFTMANDPGYADALGQTTKEFLHKASITGNPADNPNAWMQTLSDVNSRFAYPALQDYRRLNAGTGGLAALTSSAPQTDMAAVNAQAGIYNGLGGAAADVFTPRQSLADLLKSMKVSP